MCRGEVHKDPVFFSVVQDWLAVLGKECVSSFPGKAGWVCLCGGGGGGRYSWKESAIPTSPFPS